MCGGGVVLEEGVDEIVKRYKEVGAVVEVAGRRRGRKRKKGSRGVATKREPSWRMCPLPSHAGSLGVEVAVESARSAEVFSGAGLCKSQERG